MTSAQGVLPALILMMFLFCVPPFVSLRACVRRTRYLRLRGRRAAWPLAGAAFSGIALLVNLGALALAVPSIASGALELGMLHAVAAGISWLCLWIWIFLLVMVRRRHRKFVY